LWGVIRAISMSFDVKQQSRYWINSSDEDMAAAISLFDKKHYRQALFFAHLAIEKLLKSYIVGQTKDHPPRIHNLMRLSEIAKLQLNEQREMVLREFSIYKIAGRYPDWLGDGIDQQIANEDMSKAKEVIEWIKTPL